MTEKIFRINEYIVLKLENSKTNVYIGNKFFKQCKFLLINLPVNIISTFNEIDSIDEATEKLDRSNEKGSLVEIRIPPEVEFWGHCSNMQVWAEHNYNTNLIHSNLAFPLLKKLVDEGDQNAQRVIKDEIARRLEIGFPPVFEYLVEEKFIEYLSREELITAIYKVEWEKLRYLFQEGYLDFLSHKELIKILLDYREAEAILDIERITNQKLGFTLFDQEERNIYIENRHVADLNLENLDLENIPESLQCLTNLRTLDIAQNHVENIPNWISKFKVLENLVLGRNPIESLPISIIKLTKLRYLDVTQTKLTSSTISKQIKKIILKNNGEIYE